MTSTMASMSVSRIRSLSFFLGLALSFLIMASYVAIWYFKGFLFTPASHQPNPVIATEPTVATAAPDEMEMALEMDDLLAMLGRKLEYPPRTIPPEEELVEIDTLLFAVLRRKYLGSLKSPCWYAKFTDEIYGEIYRKNVFTRVFPSFKDTWLTLWEDYSDHLRNFHNGDFRLRCLPYFYLFGQPTCGTDDLFKRLLLHPDYKFNLVSEPHYWTWRGFSEGFEHEGNYVENILPKDYADLFDLAARNIHSALKDKPAKTPQKLRIVTADASSDMMSWSNHAWSEFYGGWQHGEPKIMTMDFIRIIQPAAKFVAILRNPVERLYIDYLNSADITRKSPDDFHLRVERTLYMFHACLAQRSLRSCIYNDSYTNPTFSAKFKLGMYVIFLKDWQTVFPKEQFLIIRLEDYRTNMAAELRKVFVFLGSPYYSEPLAAEVLKKPLARELRLDNPALPMHSATRTLLTEIYQPFNRKLAEVLGNPAFLWTTP